MSTSASSSETGKMSIEQLREQRAWDHLATRMEGFHNYFRQSFKQIYNFADKYERLGMDLNDFLDFADDLHHHLNAHHSIEERYVFPMLGERMPEFKQDGGRHLQEHAEIHEGLDRYAEVTKSARKDNTAYSPAKLREAMDSFEKVLFVHLDAEVETLRGTNMKKYWTLDELRRLPM